MNENDVNTKVKQKTTKEIIFAMAMTMTPKITLTIMNDPVIPYHRIGNHLIFI